MIIRNHGADRLAWLFFTDSLVIRMDLDGSFVVVYEKGSLGANHAGVCMVFKLGKSFSLASHRSEGT